jgi:hypothetical protein
VVDPEVPDVERAPDPDPEDPDVVGDDEEEDEVEG